MMRVSPVTPASQQSWVCAHRATSLHTASDGRFSLPASPAAASHWQPLMESLERQMWLFCTEHEVKYACCSGEKKKKVA